MYSITKVRRQYVTRQEEKERKRREGESKIGRDRERDSLRAFKRCNSSQDGERVYQDQWQWWRAKRHLGDDKT